MAPPKTRKRVTVRTAENLGRALGLSAADTAEMEFRSELTVALAKIIQAGQPTHAEIVLGARIVLGGREAPREDESRQPDDQRDQDRDQVVQQIHRFLRR